MQTVRRSELASPLLRTVRGLSAIERSHQDLFLAFADVTVDVHDVIIDQERQQAVLIFTIHATQQGEFLGFPASRRRTATPSAFVFTLKSGRIVRERRLYDFGGFLMQLGIIKTRNVLDGPSFLQRSQSASRCDKYRRSIGFRARATAAAKCSAAWSL